MVFICTYMLMRVHAVQSSASRIHFANVNAQRALRATSACRARARKSQNAGWLIERECSVLTGNQLDVYEFVRTDARAGKD